MPQGILTCIPYEYVPGLVTWKFSYIPENCHKVQALDKTDVQSLGWKNQIQICDHTVQMYASASTDGVHVEMTLPDRVQKVIVKKYRQCYFVLCYTIWKESLSW